MKLATREQQEIYDQAIQVTLSKIADADAVIVGGASGMSTASGWDYYSANPTFKKAFAPWYDKYHIDGIFDGIYRHWEDPEEQWGFTARLLSWVQQLPIGRTYQDLKKLLTDKTVFVWTTNQDRQFNKIYPMSQIAHPQGDAGYLQCSTGKHDRVILGDAIIAQMASKIQGTRLAQADWPRCRICGEPLSSWVRSPQFIEGTFWTQDLKKYGDFLAAHQGQKLLFLELGVGRMTPNIIKYPFWEMVNDWPQVELVSIALKNTNVPEKIKNKTLIFNADIKTVLTDLVQAQGGTNETINNITAI